jgi:hypothetical protein
VSEYEPLDDAIDRAVREMTHVATDETAVARVMARLREADARGVNARERAFVPRLAWAGAAVVVLIAVVVASYSLRRSAPDTNVPRIAKSAPAPSPAAPSSSPVPPQTQIVREIPTRAARAASTVHAATVARHARDARDADAEREPVPPPESDIEIASITPAPLAVPSALAVEPLITSSLQVEEIPLPSIEMPPVSPERNE